MLMKKILLFGAALVAAMSVNAAITEMTCAQAAAAAAQLDHNVPGTDSVAVIGYVTNTDGKISKGQQVFWMDDVKGSKKTFEGYWCNLPAEDVAAGKPLNVGDKVRIAGFLLRYNTTYEMKNGDVTVLERAVVKVDTLEATVCEAVEECDALADGDNTSDIFQVTGVVSSLGSTNDTYHTQSFYMECKDNKKSLQAYNVTMDGEYAGLGDTVFCEGRLKKYGTTLEIIGEGRVVGKASVVILPDTIEVTVAQAITAALALERGKTSFDIYVVTGYVDSIAYAYNNGSMSFFMTDDMENPAYDFEAYNVKCTEEQAAKVLVGAKVKVTSALQHYYKAATEEKPEIELAETVKGGALEILKETPTGIKNVVLTEKAQKVVVDGVVYIIRDNKMFDILGTQVK